MTITAKVLQNSAALGVPNLITVQARYPRFIHAECKTHRTIRWSDATYELLESVALMDDPLMARNASSSRAIPVNKLIEEAINDPAIPVKWQYNKSGMQGGNEMSDEDAAEAKALWLQARDQTVALVEQMLKTNPHKQLINRLLEPFTHISCVITATEWDNFFKLRVGEMADPTMRELAHKMCSAIEKSQVTWIDQGQWHLPYVTKGESLLMSGADGDGSVVRADARKISAARCARVSYLNHDGTNAVVGSDLKLAHMLISEKHMSPFEHQARPTKGRDSKGVLKGWYSLREHIEDGALL